MAWLYCKSKQQSHDRKRTNPFPADVCFAPLIQTHCIIHGYIVTARVGSWDGLWLDHVWCISSKPVIWDETLWFKRVDVIEEKAVCCFKVCFQSNQSFTDSASSYTANGDENNTKPVSFSSPLSFFDCSLMQKNPLKWITACVVTDNVKVCLSVCETYCAVVPVSCQTEGLADSFSTQSHTHTHTYK